MALCSSSGQQRKALRERLERGGDLEKTFLQPNGIQQLISPTEFAESLGDAFIFA